MSVTVLAVAIVWRLQTNPLQGFNSGAGGSKPDDRAHDPRSRRPAVACRAGGSDPLVVAQLQADAAYWEFSQEGAIARGDTAWINLPFPWVLGQTHHVTFVTNTGATFDHEIGPDPVATSGSLWSQAISELSSASCPSPSV
ncbi:MAG: hypothetical protein AAAC47_25195 [Pararhizobium sp.]